MFDFRGNEISVGDTVIYCPTNRYAGLVEATVLEIKTEPLGWADRIRTTVKVQPIKEAHWAARGAATDRSAGRTVVLTNLGRLMKVSDADPD